MAYIKLGYEEAQGKSPRKKEKLGLYNKSSTKIHNAKNCPQERLQGRDCLHWSDVQMKNNNDTLFS